MAPFTFRSFSTSMASRRREVGAARCGRCGRGGGAGRAGAGSEAARRWRCSAPRPAPPAAPRLLHRPSGRSRTNFHTSTPPRFSSQLSRLNVHVHVLKSLLNLRWLNHGRSLNPSPCLCSLLHWFGSGSFHFEREKGGEGVVSPPFSTTWRGEKSAEFRGGGGWVHSCLTLPF